MELKILKAIPDSDRSSAEELAPRFSMSVEKMKFHLENFVDRELVYFFDSTVDPTTYTLRQEGRALLVEKDLL